MIEKIFESSTNIVWIIAFMIISASYFGSETVYSDNNSFLKVNLSEYNNFTSKKIEPKMFIIIDGKKHEIFSENNKNYSDPFADNQEQKLEF